MGRERSEEERYRDSVPALVEWYMYHARILPWRSGRDPYRIWISEIMLQQTRVEAVRGYYERFLEALPSVEAVAGAPESRLLKLWEGLGYYSRVRNIAKAAKVICERYSGQLPADYERLRELPGIGEYTAGAIASIAFGIPVPAVDGNVLRVFARLTGYREDVRTEGFKKHVREEISAAMEACLPKDTAEMVRSVFGEKGLLRAVTPENADTDGGAAAGNYADVSCERQGHPSGVYNQALMDLGATVCIPNGEPDCERCPLAHLCVACEQGLTQEIPRKAGKKARPVERKTVLVIGDGERVLVHRRADRGLLAGLFEFPNVPGHLSPAAAKKAAAQILRECADAARAGDPGKYADIDAADAARAGNPGKSAAGDAADAVMPRMRAHRLPDSRHVFSHVEWEMIGYRIDLAGPDGESAGGLLRQALPEDYRMAGTDEILSEMAFGSAFVVYREEVTKAVPRRR